MKDTNYSGVKPGGLVDIEQYSDKEVSVLVTVKYEGVLNGEYFLFKREKSPQYIVRLKSDAFGEWADTPSEALFNVRNYSDSRRAFYLRYGCCKIKKK